ncbi:hypothetical protein WG66_004067, partial [Moniliophthora roreri]
REQKVDAGEAGLELISKSSASQSKARRSAQRQSRQTREAERTPKVDPTKRVDSERDVRWGIGKSR